MDRINVTSAQEMLKNCQQHASGADVFVATAAVSDYRFAEVVTGKLKRGGGGDGNGEITVRLAENTDIVAHIAAIQERPKLVIAFAAEADSHVDSGRDKMQKKGVDAIFANDISCMGSDEGAGWWLTGDSVEQAACMGKPQLAAWLLARLCEMQARDAKEGDTG